jgi:hypothetical protein
MLCTERRGRVVNTPSYFGGSRFKSSFEDRVSRLKFSWFCSVPPGNSEIVPLLRPGPLPSTSFQIHDILILPFMLYSLSD